MTGGYFLLPKGDFLEGVAGLDRLSASVLWGVDSLGIMLAWRVSACGSSGSTWISLDL